MYCAPARFERIYTTVCRGPARFLTHRQQSELLSSLIRCCFVLYETDPEDAKERWVLPALVMRAGQYSKNIET